MRLLSGEIFCARHVGLSGTKGQYQQYITPRVTRWPLQIIHCQNTSTANGPGIGWSSAQRDRHIERINRIR